MNLKNYVRSLYLLFTILGMGIAPTFAQCYIDSINDRANVRLSMSEANISTNNNSSNSWVINCGATGDTIEPITSQPVEWKNYLTDIAKTYDVPKSEIKASLVFRLSSQGKGQKIWKFDMTKDVITSDSQPYQLQANTTYTLMAEQIIGTYKSNNVVDGREINIDTPSDLDLLWRKEGVVSPLATISSTFLPSTRACTAASFIVTPSEKEVHFGTIDIRAINRGNIYTKEFTIEVRRNPNNSCATNIVKPYIKFGHYGISNADGDLVLPVRRMLFRLLDNSNSKIVFNDYYLMGELNKVSPLVTRYKAQVLRDPSGPEIQPGEFVATIAYEVLYR